MSNLYFKNVSGSNWNTLANWFTNATATIAATRVPWTSGDSTYLSYNLAYATGVNATCTVDAALISGISGSCGLNLTVSASISSGTYTGTVGTSNGGYLGGNFSGTTNVSNGSMYGGSFSGTTNLTGSTSIYNGTYSGNINCSASIYGNMTLGGNWTFSGYLAGGSSCTFTGSVTITGSAAIFGGIFNCPVTMNAGTVYGSSAFTGVVTANGGSMQNFTSNNSFTLGGASIANCTITGLFYYSSGSIGSGCSINVSNYTIWLGSISGDLDVSGNWSNGLPVDGMPALIYSSSQMPTGGTCSGYVLFANGTLSAGSYTYGISINGTFSGGTISGDAELINNGTISGGTISATPFTNNGTISGGTISSAALTNNGTITSGTFNGYELDNNNIINDGTYSNVIFVNGSPGQISGGTFIDVSNLSNIYGGYIAGGTFKSNTFTGDYGSGTFYWYLGTVQTTLSHTGSGLWNGDFYQNGIIMSSVPWTFPQSTNTVYWINLSLDNAWETAQNWITNISGVLEYATAVPWISDNTYKTFNLAKAIGEASSVYINGNYNNTVIGNGFTISGNCSMSNLIVNGNWGGAYDQILCSGTYSGDNLSINSALNNGVTFTGSNVAVYGGFCNFITFTGTYLSNYSNSMEDCIVSGAHFTNYASCAGGVTVSGDWMVNYGTFTAYNNTIDSGCLLSGNHAAVGSCDYATISGGIGNDYTTGGSITNCIGNITVPVLFKDVLSNGSLFLPVVNYPDPGFVAGNGVYNLTLKVTNLPDVLGGGLL